LKVKEVTEPTKDQAEPEKKNADYIQASYKSQAVAQSPSQISKIYKV
jgi:hypothetical protein